MPSQFPYKSYAWSIGTTSFRMADFHRKVEEQLILLNEFWQIPENATAIWSPDTQCKYYDFLFTKGFVSGNIQNNTDKQAKTARQKTSGLVDIGLLNADRRLTSVGNQLLNIALSKDFSSDNKFLLPKDSFIYFKQLLKMSQDEWGCVRPFLVLGKLIQECNGYLTDEEFTYLAPLCVNEEITCYVASKIPECRNSPISIDEIIVSVVLSRYSYPEALAYFLQSKDSEVNILKIGRNRKSPQYDRCYVPLYRALKEVYIDKNAKALPSLVQAAKNIEHKAGTLWRKLLFTERNVDNFDDLATNEFSSVQSEEDLKRVFFKYLHLYKIKSNLGDYKDLNRRYLQNTDTLLFSDGKVCFTPLLHSFFRTEAKNIFNEAFAPSRADLATDASLEEICSSLIFDEQAIIESFNAENHTTVTSIAELYGNLEQQRYEQFRMLIDRKFPTRIILDMLNQFESRESDNEIIDYVGSEADVPTIFEYIVGIIWYRLSEYKGKILEFMNLSLDSNLLPRTHAGGGESDIVYKYSQTPDYPAHSLLIECTLLKGTAQRHSEMEPVSRHLANYMLDYDVNAYCTFVSNNLHPSVVSDFRMRKNGRFYPNDTEYVENMKIVPLHTQELKELVRNGMTYKELYKIFQTAYLADDIPAPGQWYDTYIKNKICEFHI